MKTKNNSVLISEDALQQQCVRFFDMQYPALSPLLFMVNNHGKMPVQYRVKLIRMGLRKGAADLFLSIPNGNFHGLYLELKVGKNKQSPDQKEFQQQVTKYKYAYVVIYTLDEFITVVREHLGAR